MDKDTTYAFYVGGIKPTNIDSDAGIIRDVRLISEGSALGHNVDIDPTTIDQILAACQSYQNGVKVKMDHSGGAGDIAGYVSNFRKAQDSTGEYLLADLHLFAHHPQRDYILELAKTIPDTFGLSCFFVGKPETVDGRSKARCSRVFSCDIVTEPAANPSLFAVGPILRSTETSPVDKSKRGMTPEEFKAQFEKLMSERDAATKTEVVPTKETHEVKPDGSEKHVITKGATAAADKDDAEEQMSQRLAAKIISQMATAGIRIPPSVTSTETTTALAAKPGETKTETPKTFEDICYDLRTKGDDSGKKYTPTEAVTFAQRNYPDEHENYLSRCKAEGSEHLNFMQLSRAASTDGSIRVPNFVSKVEHWKVQGTPKPGAKR